MFCIVSLQHGKTAGLIGGYWWSLNRLVNQSVYDSNPLQTCHKQPLRIYQFPHPLTYKLFTTSFITTRQACALFENSSMGVAAFHNIVI